MPTEREPAPSWDAGQILPREEAELKNQNANVSGSGTRMEQAEARSEQAIRASERRE
jgi:hypothetical protein